MWWFYRLCQVSFQTIFLKSFFVDTHKKDKSVISFNYFSFKTMYCNVDIFFNPPTTNQDVQITYLILNLVSVDPSHPFLRQCLKFCSFIFLMDLLRERVYFRTHSYIYNLKVEKCMRALWANASVGGDRFCHSNSSGSCCQMLPQPKMLIFAPWHLALEHGL